MLFYFPNVLQSRYVIIKITLIINIYKICKIINTITQQATLNYNYLATVIIILIECLLYFIILNIIILCLQTSYCSEYVFHKNTNFNYKIYKTMKYNILLNF